jgi:hypothetical protein
MKKELISAGKKYVFRLIGYNGQISLFNLSDNTCSEISRLLAQWFRNKLPKADMYIAKGKIEKRFHDLLLVYDKEVYILDPTVWQFFKNKKSILIKKTRTVNDALLALADIYGGKWRISEKITKYSNKEIEKLKRVLTKLVVSQKHR